MRKRLLATFALTIAVMSPPAWGQATPAAAQSNKGPSKTWTVPFTPDGQPDLQGVWVSNGATPLERPKELAGRQFLTDAEVAELKERARRLFQDGASDYAAGDNAFLAALGNLDQYKNAGSTASSAEMIEREFDNRTSLIVDPPDGRIPALTPAAARKRAAAAAAAQVPPRGPEDLNNAVRCITFGVPKLGGNFGAGPYSYYRIVQSPGYVALFMETIHDARIIPLDGHPHLPQSIRAWNGDSRGRWEGKTLVVDTTNFSAKSNFMGSAENLHLVERFTRTAPDTIDYQITIDDPTTWVRSWTAVVRFKQTQEEIYEFACHEGNHQLMVGILGAARADEKAAAEAAAKRSK